MNDGCARITGQKPGATVPSRETWLTEMNTDQLREVLTLRREAVGDEE